MHGFSWNALAISFDKNTRVLPAHLTHCLKPNTGESPTRRSRYGYGALAVFKPMNMGLKTLDNIE
jgi:hypothetical protein